MTTKNNFLTDWVFFSHIFYKIFFTRFFMQIRTKNSWILWFKGWVVSFVLYINRSNDFINNMLQKATSLVFIVLYVYVSVSIYLKSSYKCMFYIFTSFMYPLSSIYSFSLVYQKRISSIKVDFFASIRIYESVLNGVNSILIAIIFTCICIVYNEKMVMP